MKQLRPALIAVWLIIAAAGMLAAAAPLILGATTLYSVFPVCEARTRNSRCVACGMTTAFVAIGEGRWADARKANAGAIPLYAGFGVNFAAALAYSIRKLRSGGTACKS